MLLEYFKTGFNDINEWLMIGTGFFMSYVLWLLFAAMVQPTTIIVSALMVIPALILGILLAIVIIPTIVGYFIINNKAIEEQSNEN